MLDSGLLVHLAQNCGAVTPFQRSECRRRRHDTPAGNPPGSDEARVSEGEQEVKSGGSDVSAKASEICPGLTLLPA